jgi:hypothetical protein
MQKPITPMSSERFRANQLFETDQTLRTTLSLPPKVTRWAHANYDHLVAIRDMITTYCETNALPILDRCDMPAFIACMARLSDVNAPSCEDDYKRVWDYISVKASRRGKATTAAAEVASHNEEQAAH